MDRLGLLVAQEARCGMAMRTTMRTDRRLEGRTHRLALMLAAKLAMVEGGWLRLGWRRWVRTQEHDMLPRLGTRAHTVVENTCKMHATCTRTLVCRGWVGRAA